MSDESTYDEREALISLVRYQSKFITAVCELVTGNPTFVGKIGETGGDGLAELYERIVAFGSGDLRDDFAAAALTGLVAQADAPGKDNTSREDFAAWSYEMADAMLSARKEPHA